MTWDTYLCADFSLPRPLCSRLSPDVRDRQTSDAHHRLMSPKIGAGIITRGATPKPTQDCKPCVVFHESGQRLIESQAKTTTTVENLTFAVMHRRNLAPIAGQCSLALDLSAGIKIPINLQ